MCFGNHLRLVSDFTNSTSTLTSGILTSSSEHDLLDTIEAAQDANVLIYVIRYTDLEHGKVTPRNRYGLRTLDHLSGQTGGKPHDARASGLKQAFARIADDLRSPYEVAFPSSNHVRDGSCRKVTIKTAQPNLNVRARTGYNAR